MFGRLARHVHEADGLDDKARAIIMQALSERDADSDDESLLIEALALLSADFRDGLDAYDDDDYAASIAAMEKIADSDDLFLRYNARSYVAKALVHADRLLEAQTKIENILDDADTFATYCLDEAELVYMLGYCQVQNLAHDDARITLEGFLREFPNASPRLVVTAKQMLAELARRVPESMGEVADLMNFSQQRLLAGDPGERTRGTQDRIIELLDKLIEEVEDQEQSSSQSSQQQQNQNRSQRQQQQQSEPQGPMPESKTTPGSPGGGDKLPGRQVNPGDAWGAMPAADREKILQVLRDRFPGRYRALVEQYYESLAEQP
ncbi:MAG: hypothetical protein H6817_07030 [Phycisphaerales bacterium]|nr:hypothetical protein [Phycisphaerales bacterium]